MGCTACTEPQCLYTCALYLYLLQFSLLIIYMYVPFCCFACVNYVKNFTLIWSYVFTIHILKSYKRIIYSFCQLDYRNKAII